MELTNVIRALRRHWIVVAITFAVIMGLGMFAAYNPPDRFKATAVVIVEPDPARDNVPVQVLDFIVPSLIARADSRAMGDAAASRVPAAVREAPISVSTSDTTGAGVLSVVVTSTNREAVAPWATAYAGEIVESGVGAGFVTLTVLDEARAPSQPFAPARKPVVVSAALLGVIMGVLAAIAAAAYRRRRDEVDEISDRLGIAILGEIPSLRVLDGHGIDALLAKDAPMSVTEALQTLRSNVEFLLRDQPRRVIAVVSASSGEGKSTVSASLSFALASVGEPVVAIDADLRRPMLHQYLWARLTPGLSSADHVTPADLLQPTRQPGLDLIAAGVPLPLHHPAEVLRSNLPGLVDAMQDRTVVIDCPPLDGFAETSLVTTLASSVILVVDRRRQDLLDIERAIAMLQSRGATILGIVINRSSRRNPTAGYYYAAQPGGTPSADGGSPPVDLNPIDTRLQPWTVSDVVPHAPAIPPIPAEPFANNPAPLPSSDPAPGFGTDVGPYGRS